MNHDILFTIAIALLTINSCAVAFYVANGGRRPAFALAALLGTIAFVTLASAGFVFAGVYCMFAVYLLTWANELQQRTTATQTAVAGIVEAKRLALPQLPTFALVPSYRPNWGVVEGGQYA